MRGKIKINKFWHSIFFILIFLITASIALAGPLDSIGRFTSCAGGGVINNLVSGGIGRLTGLLSSFNPFGGGSVPVNDVILNPRYQSKEYVQDLLARCVAREVLTAMNRNILDVARTAGRDGGPAFVRNWRSFIIGSQYRGEDIWRGLLYVAANGEGDIPPLLCKHIRESQAFNSLQPTKADNLVQGLGPYRRTEELPEYLVAAKCDPVVDANFDIFMNDFAAGGGWDMLERLARPQNNIFGATEMALEELNKQRSIEEKADVNEALAGSGFTSIRGTNERNSSCVIAGLGGGCIVYKDIKTPGSVVFGGINATTEQELAFVANADELNEVIAAAIQVLFNRMIDLANPDEGDYQVPGDVNFNPGSITSPPESEDPVQTCLDGCAQEQEACVDENGSNSPICIDEYNSCVDICTGELPTEFGNITVNFEIINDNGGSATAEDFELFINGEQTAIGLSRVLPVGDYAITAGSPSNYALVGIKGACDGDGSFTIEEGQNLICTVTYDDQ